MINWRSFILVFATILWACVGMTVLLLDWSARLFQLLARVGWSRHILWLAGMRVTVKGEDLVDWSRSYVIVANHQSALDIPLLINQLKIGNRFLAKRSLFYIPLFGWCLALARYIPVDRGSKTKSRRSIERAAERIRKGPSLVVFPEGTRTPDGAVHKFKSGAFIIGIRSGVPILPVAIRGTFDVVPKSRLAVHPGPVELVFGEPIPTAGLGMADKERLRKQAQAAVERMHETGAPVGRAS
jgi:1-acyl-sn-glycerol-3-phosphate acyltransferase